MAKRGLTAKNRHLRVKQAGTVSLLLWLPWNCSEPKDTSQPALPSARREAQRDFSQLNELPFQALVTGHIKSFPVILK